MKMKILDRFMKAMGIIFGLLCFYVIYDRGLKDPKSWLFVFVLFLLAASFSESDV
jgi:hypothetical protein